MATPAQAVSYLQDLTLMIRDLQGPAETITSINSQLIIVGQGPFPQIIQGLKDVASTSNTAISSMENMPPVAAGTQSDAIFEAFNSV